MGKFKEAMIDFDDTEYTGNKDFDYAQGDFMSEGDGSTAGMMENYGQDLSNVEIQSFVSPKTVWTIIDGDVMTIKAGMDIYEAFMFFVSNEEWTDPKETYTWGDNGRDGTLEEDHLKNAKLTGHCPKCGHSETDGRGFDFVDHSVVAEYECERCSAQWTSTYEINSIEVDNEK